MFSAKETLRIINLLSSSEVKTEEDIFLETKLVNYLINLKILEKWQLDKQTLPLEDSCFDLYKNIHVLYFYYFSSFPNLITPSDYNQKIQWLKIFDHDPKVVQCSDKLGVRDYVKTLLGEEYLPIVYQIGERFEDIDLSKLPEKYVIKTNHDSGSVFINRGDDSFDIVQVTQKVAASLSRTYGWEKGEWSYRLIQPKVFVEEYLDFGCESKSPPDFKFHCVDGKVKWLQYIYDRGVGTKEVIVSRDGIVTDIHFDHNMQHSEVFTLPTQWDKLIEIAERLSSNFKYVRVDLYIVKEKVYVGELTFFPLMGCYRSEGQKVLGNLLDFDLSTYKSSLCHLFVKS